MTEIYKRLKDRNVVFSHVCEVGVYLPETSNIIDFIKDGIRATLVEADLELIPKIKGYFKGYAIQLYPVAIWDYNGKLTLSKALASTFVSDLHASPAIINDGFKKDENPSFEVECRTFSDVDDGTIDLLSVDIEGSEWYVLKHLVSNPKVISIETHGKTYINPFIDEINSWMSKNNYVIWYKDKSDSVFIKDNLFEITFFERMSLKAREFRIGFRKNKVKLKKSILGK